MAKSATAEHVQAAPVELVQLDPATLTLETNVRTITEVEQAKIDDLAASIAEVGVYTPLRAVRDQAGQVMVRDGQRRLLAAQQAGVTTVPVVIHTEDGDGDEREAARISQQVLANSGRALTGEDTAAAIDQLAMFGIPADQIATRTGVDRDKVAATVATAESKTVRAQVIEHDMTLEQASALLEFEDDENAMGQLTRAAQYGNFDHVLQQLRQLRAAAAAREEAAQPYRDKGIGVLDRRPYYYEPTTPDGEKLHVVSAYVTENGTPATADDVAPERLWVYLTEDETYHVKGALRDSEGAVAIWGDGVGKPITPGVPDPRPDISGAGEGLGHDHRIRVRTPEGEHPALAFA